MTTAEPVRVRSCNQGARRWTRAEVRCQIRRTFGTHADAALRVAWCESRLDPHATNRSSGAAGIYQFLPSTWRAAWNPHRRRSPYDALANIRAARELYRIAGWTPWACRP